VIDTERTVLGSILLDGKAFDEAASFGMTAEDFSLDSHRCIYRAICELAESGSAIDTVTLVHYLDVHRELAKIGDVGYVAGLVDGVPDRPSIKHYLRIVKEESAKRKLAHACESVGTGLEVDMTSGDAMSYLTDQMMQIQTGSDEPPAKRVIEFSDLAYAEWLKIADGGNDLIGLTTGSNCVDVATTGIWAGEFWVYAGRTGDGKTNLALQTVAANCRQDNAVAVFSIEMSKESLLHRLWAAEGQVDFKHVRFPRRLLPETKKRIQAAMIEVGQWPLHIIDQGGISLQRLVAKAQLLIRRERVRLVVVDYIQLITTAGPNERERMSKVSRTLAAMAKDTGVPVVAISQLARPRDGNENFRPRLFNLKESGSIENDANVVLLIYRPVDDRKMKTGEDELIIDKQRSGVTSIENVCFMPWLRFHEREVAR
jgi:replicative DNA helicase